jgi:perosamine synthetase
MSVNASREIPLSFPAIGEKEVQYVMDCLRTSWISSSGEYVERFEEAFAAIAGTRHAVSCSNGTAALHLALLAMGLSPGDEVLVPALTFVAPANAVVYCGGKPVFVDVERDIWCMDPSQIEERITPKTRGIITVHLRGHPSDMDAILEIAKRHNLFVIEDAAQAHGALARGRPVGSMGRIGTFSFFGNKMITTGEGGMITTDDDQLAGQIRLLKNQGMTRDRRYWHPVVGYNYRMTNIQAAIGVAQTERFETQLSRHREVAAWYQEALAGVPGLTWQKERDWAKHAWWQFVAIVEDDFGSSRDNLISNLRDSGIDARRLYFPLHRLPPYQDVAHNNAFPVADDLASRGVCLPTWSGLQRDDVNYVCDRLKGLASSSA